MRFDNIDERTVIKSANDEYDDKRNMYSPEIFLSDDAFDPDLKYLNSPATIDVLGKCCPVAPLEVVQVVQLNHSIFEKRQN